ncbi:hypothetical protein BJ878DRAFT_247331 [Calycina marina]|uniref:Uncharacterized protein n=1 Tax=Calycina marina TaxID=1763456 RepID=A0A9P7Z7C2_9HELO|nr:hypothetical protein BJ878DRAFT_247331 [Calycina marina]
MSIVSHALTVLSSLVGVSWYSASFSSSPSFSGVSSRFCFLLTSCCCTLLIALDVTFCRDSSKRVS